MFCFGFPAFLPPFSSHLHPSILLSAENSVFWHKYLQTEGSRGGRARVQTCAAYSSNSMERGRSRRCQPENHHIAPSVSSLPFTFLSDSAGGKLSKWQHIGGNRTSFQMLLTKSYLYKKNSIISKIHFKVRVLSKTSFMYFLSEMEPILEITLNSTKYFFRLFISLWTWMNESGNYRTKYFISVSECRGQNTKPCLNSCVITICLH